MSLVITGFDIDRQEVSTAWKGRGKPEKKASLLSRALAAPQQSPRTESFSFDPYTYTTEEGTDDESDEDCDSEESHSSSQSSSVPIPQVRSRVAKLFSYARFQLHVQQAQIQEMQDQQKQAALMQQDKVVYGQMGLQQRS